MDTRTNSMSNSDLSGKHGLTGPSPADNSSAAAVGSRAPATGPHENQNPVNNPFGEFSNHLFKGVDQQIENNDTGDSVPSAGIDTHGKISSYLKDLNSDGDQAVFQVRTEVKATLGLGVKGQYGYQVRVAQKGGELPEGMTGQTTPPEYQVTFDKKLLGGINGKLPVPVIDPSGELNLRTADSVTMTFETKEEAARAVELLGRVAAADTIRDTGSVASISTSPMGDTASLPQNPLTEEVDSTSSLMSLGSPPTILDFAAGAVEPSGDDMTFLTDHISGYSTRLDGQARIKAGADLPLGALNLEAELRGDRVAGITRTVEIPRNGEPGSVTYTLDLKDKLSSKDGLDFGPSFSDAFTADAGVHARLEHMTFDRSVSFTWEYPENQMGPTISGQPYPEIGSVANGGLRAPDNITVRLDGGRQDQALWDPTRTDFVNGSIELSVDQPGPTASEAVKAVLNGKFGEAIEMFGENTQLTVSSQTTERSGFDLQPGFGLEIADLFDVKASLIVEAGVDDVTRREAFVLGGQPHVPNVQSPAQVEEGVSVGEENQVVAVPQEGLTLRSAPGGELESVFYHGTFLTPTGDHQTDPDGRLWVEVSGLDVNDHPVTGWVDADYLVQHPAGAMNGEGRINPDLQKEGYRAHRAETGENLYDIAKAYGYDFQETMALNEDHLIDPSLIFEGDVVYLPVKDQSVPDQPKIAPPAAAQESVSEPDSTTESNSNVASTEVPADVSQPAEAPVPQVPDHPHRRPAEEILGEYQVAEDKMTTWRPKVGPLNFIEIPFQAEHTLAETEAQLLDELGGRNGIYGLYRFNDAREAAYETADDYFPQEDNQHRFIVGGEDGHNDAFRHAYWNALMTKRFGEEFATAFGTAHEARPGNFADREAMDLYNNELGRNIATANPDASDEQLGQLIFDAIQAGEAMVIDGNGDLVYSHQVAYGDTGQADDLPVTGTAPVPEWVNSN